MRTLYLRNVPDAVGERLERLARREGMSMSSFVVRELERISQRADNPALLGDLPDLNATVDDVLSDLDSGRGGR